MSVTIMIFIRMTSVMAESFKKKPPPVISVRGNRILGKSFNFLALWVPSMSSPGSHNTPVNFFRLFKIWKCSENCVVHTLLVTQSWLFGTPWTAAHQAPLSMRFSRQEYWSGLPFPSPGDLPNPGVEPGSPALHADSLPPELLSPFRLLQNTELSSLGCK